MIRQIRQTELFFGKTVAVIVTDHAKSANRNGVDRVGDAAQNRSGEGVGSVVIFGERAAGVADRQILHNRGRTDGTGFKGGCVHSNRLHGRTGLQLGVGCDIPAVVGGFFADTAGHGHDVTGGYVHDDHGGLKLLLAAGLCHVGRVIVNRIHLILHGLVQRGVNMITTPLNLQHIVILCRLIQRFPVDADLCGQVRHIFQNGIDEIGIHNL